LTKQPLLSIVIVTYNSSKIISQTLLSIVNYLINIEYEIIIVDNNSSDNTCEIISQINNSNVKLIKNKVNKGFAQGNNKGFKVCNGEFILILNPDIIITPNTHIDELIDEYNKNEKIGIVAPKLIYEDGRVQESARSFPNPIVLLIRGLGLENIYRNFEFYKKFLLLDKNDNLPTYVDWVIGAFVLIKKDILIEHNGFDDNFFMYYEDADLCLRLKKTNYKILYVPQYEAIHQYQRESSKKIFSKLKFYHIKSIIIFFSKHWAFLLLSSKKKF